MVDLPAPVAPTKATVSPGAMVRSTSCSTGTAGSYPNDTWSKRISPRIGGSSTASGASEHRGLGLEQAAQLEDGGPALLERVVLLHQQLDRREEPVHVEEEGGQLAEVDLLRVVQVHGAADAQDQQLAEDADDLRARPVDAVDAPRVVVGVAVRARRRRGGSRRCSAAGCAR